MGIWDKIKGKFRVPSAKESQTSKVILAGDYGVLWPERNYENFAKEAYVKNAVAYKAIEKVSKNVASAPWGLYKEDADGKRTEIDNHEILSLIKRPNPSESWMFLILKIIAFKLISGNSYIERVSPITGARKGIPKELYVLRPDRMRIEADPDTGMIVRYIYEVNGREVYWEVDPITRQADILHFLEFHPTNDWYGLSPVEPAARHIDINNQAAEWNKKLLENECRPGMVFTVVGNLNEQQYDRIEKQLKNKYGGFSNAGRSLILEGESGTKAEAYAWSPAEMDFIEGNRESARKIADTFGVPPMLLGIPGDNTYSNYKEARLAFWEDTIIPHLVYLKEELNSWFFPDNKDGLFLDFDLDEIPALAPRREMNWERAIKSGDFLDINERRELIGKEAKPNLDVIFVPATMVPIEQAVMPPEEQDQQDFEEDEETIDKLMQQGLTKEDAEKMIEGDYD